MADNDWEYLPSDGYEIDITDNYFEYIENMTIYYDIDDPYDWIISSPINFTYTYTKTNGKV